MYEKENTTKSSHLKIYNEIKTMKKFFVAISNGPDLSSSICIILNPIKLFKHYWHSPVNCQKHSNNNNNNNNNPLFYKGKS